MILHCVFLRFKAAVQEEEKIALYEAIAALKEFIPGMMDVKYGTNVSPEGLDRGFVDGFVVTFEDSVVRDYYLNHPEHKAVGERIVKALDGGLSGIMVYDMES